MNQSIEEMKEGMTDTMNVIFSQLNGISKKLDAKFPNKMMRTRGLKPKSVVYSSDETEPEDEDMKDVEDEMLTLFRKMTRVRQRKFPVEKIQSEISAVRSLESINFYMQFL